MRGFYIRASFGVVARLDATVAYIAQALEALGDTSPLDERRVKAVLILANPLQAVEILQAYAAWRARSGEDQPADTSSAADTAPKPFDPERPPTEPAEPPVDWSKLLPAVWLYVHVYGHSNGQGIARVEGMGAVTEQWVREHLGEKASFKITEVLDLAGQAPVDAYEIPERQRQAVHLMTPADIFPFSSSTSRDMQVDHNVPFRHGSRGQSRIGNYGPMTTLHHRIKTHGDWQVQQPFPGIYVWRDPHGAFYLVDHTGTRRTPKTQDNRRHESRLEVYLSQILLAA